jgi:neopullulanase
MKPLRQVLVSFVVVIMFSIAALAQSVKKVEPANWWIGLPHNPMLLVYGEGLGTAKVTTDYPGISISKVETQPNGHHLFVWVRVANSTKPGQVKFQVQSEAKTTEFSWDLAKRESTKGKFQGISNEDVIYLIMPDRFADGDTKNDIPVGSPGQTDRKQSRKWHGGDLAGVSQHLGYIQELGATAVWLTPWWEQNPATSDYHGYGSVDFYAVDPHLGTMQDLRSMVKTAHERGMKIVLDYVPNHTGPAHPWVDDPPTPTWLHGTRQSHPKFAYDFKQLIDPHATRLQYRNVLEGWFADTLADINGEDPHAAEYLIDNAIWWTEMTGLDAYRLDTFPYSSLKFWNQWHTAIFTVYPHMWSVGEVMSDDPWITSYFVGGQLRPKIDTKLTTVFDFPSEFALRKIFGEGASMKTWIGVLQHDDLYPNPDGLVSMLSNHDHSRFASLPGMTPQKFNAAFALLLTMRGIPQLYSGDEVYMPGGEDPDNRRDFPGGFPGDARSAFTEQGRTKDEQAVFANIRELLKIRREHSALRSGKMWHLLEADDAYAFVRMNKRDSIVVAYNDTAKERTLTIHLEDTPVAGIANARAIYGGGQAQSDGKELTVRLGPYAVGIFMVDKVFPH